MGTIGNHVFKIMTGLRFWLHRLGANISPQPLVGPYVCSPTFHENMVAYIVMRDKIFELS